MSRSSSSTEPDYDIEIFEGHIVLPTRGRGAPSRGDSAEPPSPSSSYDRPRDSRRSHDDASYDSDELVPVTHSHRPSTARIDQGDTVMAGEAVNRPGMSSYIPSSEDHYDPPSRQLHQGAVSSFTAAELDELLSSIRTICDPFASPEDQGDAFCMANRHLDRSCSNYTLVDKTYAEGMRTTMSQLEDQLGRAQDMRTLAEERTGFLQRQLSLTNAWCQELGARCERLDMSSQFNAMEQESLVRDLFGGIGGQNTNNGQDVSRATRGHSSAA